MIANHVHKIGLLSLLSLCLVPAQANAGEATIQHGYRFTAAQKSLIIAGITAIYLVCSEDARSAATRATLLSSMACLRLLMKSPLPDAMKQKIKEKIDYLETIYTTCINKPKLPSPQFSIKDVVDALKAAEWVVG